MSDQMITVKFSYPEAWKNDFWAQTPHKKGALGNYTFELNNDCSECDVWVVWGALEKEESCLCPPDNVFYITDESHDERFFEQSFLDQFTHVIACREDLQHQHIIKSNDLGIWHIQRSYDTLTSPSYALKKDRELSIITSDKVWLEGHKKRYAFANKMIGHFKDRLGVYGRGFNPIEDKADGLERYQFSIAIENSTIPDYFTEKLWDCFLTYTVPFYYGYPNLPDYFPKDAYIEIDLNDYQKSIEIMEEKLADQNSYEHHLSALKEARALFLEKYHLFPAVCRHLDKNMRFDKPKKKIRLRPEKITPSLTHRAVQKVKRFLKQ
jgi:hypothetical protein